MLVPTYIYMIYYRVALIFLYILSCLIMTLQQYSLRCTGSAAVPRVYYII